MEDALELEFAKQRRASMNDPSETKFVDDQDFDVTGDDIGDALAAEFAKQQRASMGSDAMSYTNRKVVRRELPDVVLKVLYSSAFCVCTINDAVKSPPSSKETLMAPPAKSSPEPKFDDSQAEADDTLNPGLTSEVTSNEVPSPEPVPEAPSPETVPSDSIPANEQAVDINVLSTEVAADLIWERMRAYMKEKGGQRATELFNEIDKDRSGKIDVNEFLAALERMNIPGVSKNAAKAVIKTIDPNGDGQLEYKEILPMLKAPRRKPKEAEVAQGSSAPAAAVEEEVEIGIDYNALPTEEAADLIWERMRAYMKEKGGQRATELFKEMDKDRSGKIDVDEFIAALERMDIKGVNKKVAKAVIKTVDPNGDGQLEYKEILPMLKALRKKKEDASSRNSFGSDIFGQGLDGATDAFGGIYTAISSSAGEASEQSGVNFAAAGLKSAMQMSEGLPEVPQFSMPEALSSFPELPDLGFSGTVPPMPSFDDMPGMPSIPDFMSTEQSNVNVDLEQMTTEEAADLIWDRMRTYMKEKGGQRATDLFKEMDKDRSGKIDTVEFIAALERMEIRGVKKKLAKAIIKTVDPNGDGQLEYKEILPMLKEPRRKK
jgi:Ca2+-binding EF-hand superfamily protein